MFRQQLLKHSNTALRTQWNTIPQLSSPRFFTNSRSTNTDDKEPESNEPYKPRHNIKVHRRTPAPSSAPVIVSNQDYEQPQEQPYTIWRMFRENLIFGVGFGLGAAILISLFSGGRKQVVIHDHSPNPYQQGSQETGPAGLTSSEQDYLIQQASQYYAANPHGLDRNSASNYANTTSSSSSDDLIRQAEKYYASQGKTTDVGYSGTNEKGLSNTTTTEGKRWW